MPFSSRSLYKALLVALFAGALLMVCAGRAEGETTLASWYGPGFEGLPTASGEPYEPYGYTAAHKTLPLGTELVVSYGGNSVGVTVNDRGPYVGARELDLSQGAAEALGLTQAGVDYVEYSYAGGLTGDQYGNDRYTSAWQYAQPATPAYDQYVTAATGDRYGTVGAVAGYTDETVGVDATGADQLGSGAGYSDGGLHVVRPGETLSGISTRLGVSVEDLAAGNAIADPDVIFAGQTLYY